MERTIHWSWMTSAIICSNKNIQKLAYSNIVWTFWHISSHENLCFKNLTCSFFLIKSPRIRRHLHQRPSEFHEAWSCNSHEWKGRMSPLKGVSFTTGTQVLRPDSWPNMSIFMVYVTCAYLERLWTKTRWEKQKHIIPFCKLTQQMSALEKAVPPKTRTVATHQAWPALNLKMLRITFGFIKPWNTFNPIHPP